MGSGGSSSSSGRGSGGARNGYSIGSTINVGKYSITSGVVTTPSGKSTHITEYRELSASEKRSAEKMVKDAGIIDPVASGRLILPRKVADAAINQRKMEREAIRKNVPGLEELRNASYYDDRQRAAFRRSVESGTGVLKGSPTSHTYADVAKKYPRAAAYLQAEGYYHAFNDVKSKLGREAMNKIASGRSASAAIAEMKKRWKKHANRSVD